MFLKHLWRSAGASLEKATIHSREEILDQLIEKHVRQAELSGDEVKVTSGFLTETYWDSWEQADITRVLDDEAFWMGIAALRRGADFSIVFGPTVNVPTWHNSENKANFLLRAEAMVADMKRARAIHETARKSKEEAARLRSTGTVADEIRAREIERETSEQVRLVEGVRVDWHSLSRELGSALAKDRDEFHQRIIREGELLHRAECTDHRGNRLERRLMGFQGRAWLMQLSQEPVRKKTGRKVSVKTMGGGNIHPYCYETEVDETIVDGFAAPVLNWVTDSPAQFTTAELSAAGANEIRFNR